MKLLALDIGEKRIGLATGDTDLGIAFPGEIFEHEKGIYERIAEFCAQENIEQMIIGHPITMGGEKGTAVQRTELFVTKLKEYIDLPMKFFDERFSTKTARKEVSSKTHVDAAAAAIFLQQYLDMHS